MMSEATEKAAKTRIETDSMGEIEVRSIREYGAGRVPDSTNLVPGGQFTYWAGTCDQPRTFDPYRNRKPRSPFKPIC